MIAGAVDAGLAVGTLGAMSAFAKGAPVRIIAAEATGAADYWYSRTSSPIRTLKDTNGHTIAYSTRGSSTDSIVRAFITEFGLTAKPVATGNPSATLAAVMSDQVDVGWSSPPYGLKEMEDGKIRLVAKATEAAIVRDQTIRVIVANAQALEQRKDVFRRFMQAYRDSIDYMYGDSPQVIIDYAAFVGVPEFDGAARARRFLSQVAGQPRRDQGARLADARGGGAQVHHRAADEGAIGAADPTAAADDALSATERIGDVSRIDDVIRIDDLSP